MNFRHKCTLLTWSTLLLGAAVPLRAQVTVTDIQYGARQNGWNTNEGGISFRNEYYPVETVNTTVGEYRFDGPLANDVYFRRQAGWGDPNNTTLFYQTDRNNNPYGTHPDNAADVFLQGNLTTGLRDPFANDGSASEYQNSNIERIDFYFGDYVVQEGDGFVLFDLENIGNQGDAFRVAAFDGWDAATATPDSYANTGLNIGSDSFGSGLNSPTDNGSREFHRATYTDGDVLTGSPTGYTDLGEGLELVGILIRFTDLGLEVGDTIQGFSLMASDVTATTSVDLVDWNDSSVYRNNTDRNTYGNVDFMGFGAQVATPVPEPSTYGALFIGSLIAFFGFRRWRSRQPQTNAA